VFRKAEGIAGEGGFPTAPSGVSERHGNTHMAPIKKADDELQIVWSEVYAPGVPDSQGDFMSRESIREMAYEFMRKGLVTKIDLNHTQQESGCYVVESFIARDDDPIFIPGSWVLGVKVPDPEIWRMVKSGELNGFSFDGVGIRRETEIELYIPETIEGETDEVDGHRHRFFVKYDEEGRFLGGYTSPGPDGHVHKILRGTITEEENGHAHRFSFVEVMVNAESTH